jgi:hypothetical protein
MQRKDAFTSLHVFIAHMMAARYRAARRKIASVHDEDVGRKPESAYLPEVFAVYTSTRICHCMSVGAYCRCDIYHTIEHYLYGLLHFPVGTDRY